MRTLIHVPIVHAGADLGSLAEEVRRRFPAAHGEEAWACRSAALEAMWDGLRERLLGLPIAWRRVRVYQDGLPVCGHEVEIVRDVAAAGSRNHQLLLALMERGATVMGTEDPDLVVAEYRRIRRLIEAARAGAPDAAIEEIAREGERILLARDVFIARRIDDTLGEDETGILFLGLLHRVDEALRGRLDELHVIHSLPFGADLRPPHKETPDGD